MNEYGMSGKANEQFQSSINTLLERFDVWPIKLPRSTLKRALELAYVAGQENERIRSHLNFINERDARENYDEI